MSSSSIKLLLPGAEVDCSTNTSAPRTFSLISILLSPSLKVSTVALPRATFRYWLISAARGGFELPAKIFNAVVGCDMFVGLGARSVSIANSFYDKTTAPSPMTGAFKQPHTYYLNQLSATGTGWAGRIRTFDTGSKVQGLTAWRPPIPELHRGKFIRSREISNQS